MDVFEADLLAFTDDWRLSDQAVSTVDGYVIAISRRCHCDGAFVRRGPRSKPSLRQRSRLMIAVAVGGGLAPILLVLALDRTPAGQVSLFLNLELVATTVIARLFLQEHIGRRAASGTVLVVLGV